MSDLYMQLNFILLLIHLQHKQKTSQSRISIHIGLKVQTRNLDAKYAIEIN
jgi:hypothetical protein